MVDEDLDDAPTVFAAKHVGTLYYISEGGTNPGWGELPQGDARRFKIEVDNVDSARFHFHRTDGSGNWQYAGFYNNANMNGGGNPLANTESRAYCDTLAAHFFGMERMTSQTSSWTDWADEIKDTTFSEDFSKWYYWNPVPGSGVEDSYVAHCSTAYCQDFTGN